MNNTTKIITVRLSKEDTRILELLTQTLGESKSNVIRRALNDLLKSKKVD